MWFADFMLQVPGWARLLVAVLVTAGVSLTAVVVLRPRILQLNAGPEERSAADGSDIEAAELREKDLGVSYLAGDATRIVGTAFVFLLAFSLGQFWGNVKDARSAIEAEQGAGHPARQVPGGGPGRDASVMRALPHG